MPECGKSAKGGIQLMSQERRHGGGRTKKGPLNVCEKRCWGSGTEEGGEG